MAIKKLFISFTLSKLLSEFKMSINGPHNVIFYVQPGHILTPVSASFTAPSPSWSKPEGLWLIDLPTRSRCSSWKDKTFTSYTSSRKMRTILLAIVFLIYLGPSLGALSLNGRMIGVGDGEKTEAAISGAKLLKRVRRGWLWNQFFLQEEYTGSDYQYIGKVRAVPLYPNSWFN